MHLTETSKFPTCWVNSTMLSLLFHVSSGFVSPRSVFVVGAGGFFVCMFFVFEEGAVVHVLCWWLSAAMFTQPLKRRRLNCFV